MKKLLNLFLATMLVLTVAFGMSACGEEEKASGNKDTQSTGSSSSQSGSSTGSSVFPAALKDIQAFPVQDISNTGWECTGGIVDGVEMETSDVTATLDAVGGKIQFIFQEDKAVQMVTGQASYSGNYSLIQENYALYIQLDGVDYTYYGVFTTVNEATVMIIANSKEPETALYFTQIDEH